MIRYLFQLDGEIDFLKHYHIPKKIGKTMKLCIFITSWDNKMLLNQYDESWLKNKENIKDESEHIKNYEGQNYNFSKPCFSLYNYRFLLSSTVVIFLEVGIFS